MLRRNKNTPASRAYAKVRELDAAKKPKKVYALKIRPVCRVPSACHVRTTPFNSPKYKT